MKYQKRREALKKLKDPKIQLMRQFAKASPVTKGAIIAGAILPKALLLGAGYAGAKSANKKEQPKKYMKG